MVASISRNLSAKKFYLQVFRLSQRCTGVSFFCNVTSKSHLRRIEPQALFINIISKGLKFTLLSRNLLAAVIFLLRVCPALF
jgi:hypothetical protein